MITIEQLEAILQGKADPTDETILPYLMWARHPLPAAKYKKYVDGCTNDDILAALFFYHIGRTESYITRNQVRQMNDWAVNILTSAFPEKIIKAGEKANYNMSKIKLLRIIVGMEGENVYDRVFDKLTGNIPLNKKDIKELSKEDIDKIFDNYKDIKSKVRLYSLTASKNFNKKYVSKAMKNLGFASFCIDDGENCPVPFKLSYIKDMIVSDPRFYRIIEFVTRSSFAYFLKDNPDLVLPNMKNYYSNKYRIGLGYAEADGGVSNSLGGGRNYIKLDIDMTKEQIVTQFFPLMLKNEEVYKVIMKNLGVVCRFCAGDGWVLRECKSCKPSGHYYCYRSNKCTVCNGTGMVKSPCICGGGEE